jgi:hypothetical protein
MTPKYATNDAKITQLTWRDFQNFRVLIRISKANQNPTAKITIPCIEPVLQIMYKHRINKKQSESPLTFLYSSARTLPNIETHTRPKKPERKFMLPKVAKVAN